MNEALTYQDEQRKSESWGRKNSIKRWPTDRPDQWYESGSKKTLRNVTLVVGRIKNVYQRPVFLRNRPDATVTPFLPPAISSLVHFINESQTKFPSYDNWDEEGSSGYSESTWRRVETFLTQNAIHFLRRQGYCFPPPEFSPGPKGSIDLFWRLDNRELLINIPAELEEPPSFYGDDREDGTKNAIRGKKLDESQNNDWVFLWLTK